MRGLQLKFILFVNIVHNLDSLDEKNTKFFNINT